MGNAHAFFRALLDLPVYFGDHLFLRALVIWAVTVPFDATRSLLHRYSCWWAQLQLRCLPGCQIQIEGAEKIAPGTAYVLIANHQSTADIMALSALYVRFKWVSKRENFRIPFIGWNMYLNGYVKVDRGNRESVRKTMEHCRMWQRRGVSTLWFPEGQRSPTGELQRFHSGDFPPRGRVRLSRRSHRHRRHAGGLPWLESVRLPRPTPHPRARSGHSRRSRRHRRPAPRPCLETHEAGVDGNARARSQVRR